MKKLMGLMTSGFTEELLIKPLNGRILMRFADRHGRILVIQGFCPKGSYVCKVTDTAWLLGLAAAINAAAGTSHDLNKMIPGFAGLHFI